MDIFRFVFGVVMIMFILEGLRGYDNCDSDWKKFLNNFLFIFGLLGFVTYLQW